MPKRSRFELCYWCGVSLCHDCRHTIGPDPAACGGTQLHLCRRASTNDHLLPRDHPARAPKGKSGPIVVACLHCNTSRGHDKWTAFEVGA